MVLTSLKPYVASSPFTVNACSPRCTAYNSSRCVPDCQTADRATVRCLRRWSFAQPLCQLDDGRLRALAHDKVGPRVALGFVVVRLGPGLGLIEGEKVEGRNAREGRTRSQIFRLRCCRSGRRYRHDDTLSPRRGTPTQHKTEKRRTTHQHAGTGWTLNDANVRPGGDQPLEQKRCGRRRIVTNPWPKPANAERGTPAALQQQASLGDAVLRGWNYY
jgi:hypothetical protein